MDRSETVHAAACWPEAQRTRVLVSGTQSSSTPTFQFPRALSRCGLADGQPKVNKLMRSRYPRISRMRARFHVPNIETVYTSANYRQHMKEILRSRPDASKKDIYILIPPAMHEETICKWYGFWSVNCLNDGNRSLHSRITYNDSERAWYSRFEDFMNCKHVATFLEHLSFWLNGDRCLDMALVIYESFSGTRVRCGTSRDGQRLGTRAVSSSPRYNRVI
jgi:hypothetical protein